MPTLILIQPRPASRLESRENLELALALLASCRGKGADLICFPEYFPFAGEEELSRAARELESYLVAGLVEETAGGRYNTATLFDRAGNMTGRQRKHTLGALERRGFGVIPGSHRQVFDTDFGKLGLAVCIDFWGQPQASQELADQKADLVINPSIFPILRGHWSLGALVRAFDHYLPVAGVNTAGFTAEIAGRQYPMQGGGSFAIQPPAPADEAELARLVRGWDELSDWFVLKAGDDEGIFSVRLELEGPRRWRQTLWERFGIRR